MKKRNKVKRVDITSIYFMTFIVLLPLKTFGKWKTTKKPFFEC